MVAIESIKNFFKTSDILVAENKYITVDSVKDDYDNVSVQLTGMTPSIYEDCLGLKHVNGWSINFNLFVYSNIEGQSEAMHNNMFTQNLSLWLTEKNIKNELPVLLEGFETATLTPSNIGLFERHDNGNCIYLIQCKANLRAL